MTIQYIIINITQLKLPFSIACIDEHSSDNEGGGVPVGVAKTLIAILMKLDKSKLWPVVMNGNNCEVGGDRILT